MCGVSVRLRVCVRVRDKKDVGFRLWGSGSGFGGLGFEVSVRVS